MTVYIPIKRQDVGMIVQAVPAEQLVYISNRRCLRQTREGYETEFAYNTDFLFKTEQAAWDFLMDKDVKDDFYYCRKDLWPHKNFTNISREERIMKNRDKLKNQ